MIASERAWIMLDSIEPHPEHLTAFIAQQLPVNLRVIFRNFGKVPAWVIGDGLTFSIERKDFQPPEEYEGKVVYSFGKPVPPEPLPENWVPVRVLVDMNPLKLSREQIEDVAIRGEQILVLRGNVLYRDSFSDSLDKTLKTSICLKLRFRSPDGHTPPNWEYFNQNANRYT